jgi:hypothetical protein
MQKNIKLLLALFSFVGYASAQSQIERNNDKNTIQLALLLDVSNSMDGLINQAKTELWSIVNEAATASKNQEQTVLEIALYEYGKSSLPKEGGYIRKILDFTTDLDTVSKALFGLNTNGGDEYCGQVIDESVKNLIWRDNDSVFKVIFIAGNEEFTQGTLHYKIACENAQKKHIVVNTIHCGDSATGVRHFWKNGANIGKGKYFYINQNATFIDFDTPYDSLISLYNDSLNTTYIHYGSKGYEYKTNQSNQDVNNKKLNKKAYLERAKSKSNKKAYKNVHWDAVDAYIQDSTVVTKIYNAGIDNNVKVKDTAELKKLILKKSNDRARYQSEIAKLSDLRAKFILEKQSAMKSKDITLGDALAKALKTQASTLGFSFSK